MPPIPGRRAGGNGVPGRTGEVWRKSMPSNRARKSTTSRKMAASFDTDAGVVAVNGGRAGKLRVASRTMRTVPPANDSLNITPVAPASSTAWTDSRISCGAPLMCGAKIKPRSAALVLGRWRWPRRPVWCARPPGNNRASGIRSSSSFTKRNIGHCATSSTNAPTCCRRDACGGFKYRAKAGWPRPKWVRSRTPIGPWPAREKSGELAPGICSATSRAS